MAPDAVESALSWTDLQLLGSAFAKMLNAGITETEFVCGGGTEYPRVQALLSPEELGALRRLGLLIDALEEKN